VIDKNGVASSGEGLVRAIGRWSMAALIVNCIIGSGAFGLPSILAGLLGHSSIAAVVLAAGAVAVIMACFSEVASRFDASGGPYLYAQAAFGRFMGIQVAWLMWFVRLTSCAANANLFVTYLGEFWPGSASIQATVLILTVLIGLLAVINLLGVRAGTRVSDWFAVAKLASLLLVVVLGVFYLARHGSAMRIGSISPERQWASGLVLIIFAYGGFETGLISAGEAKNPRRDIPFGLFVGLATCAVIYGSIQWVVMGVLPDAGHSQRPLADVARVVLGHGGAVLVAAGALISIYGYLSGNILATPRITFALAERGDFPSVFARIHPRFRTPYFSIVIFSALVWLLARFGSFAGNATLSAGSRLFYYAVVCASLPALRRKTRIKAPMHLPGGTALSVLGVLICVVLASQIELGKSLILVGAVAIAFVNWLAVRNTSKIT